MFSVDNTKTLPFPRSPRRQKSLRETVGFIPATIGTPDIYYCDDKSSEKVALLTFLTLWFMDDPIRQIVKSRSPSIICGLSPLSGGGRLERVFTRSSSSAAVTARLEKFDPYSAGTSYAGRCYQPDWDSDGGMRRNGLIAVYATSIRDDEFMGYTHKWYKKLSDQFKGLTVPQEDSEYLAILDRPFHNGVERLSEAFVETGDEREDILSQLLMDNFSDCNELYDLVPLIVAHEVGHLLSHGTGVVPVPVIAREIARNIPATDKKYKYFRTPREAVAELAGIALLEQVEQNSNLGFAMPSSFLDEKLPCSYAYCQYQIDCLCDDYEDKKFETVGPSPAGDF